MRELTIQVDDETLEWIERGRGDHSLEEHAAGAIKEHMAEMDALSMSARLHEHLIGRLDELEARIERLNAALRKEKVRLRAR